MKQHSCTNLIDRLSRSDPKFNFKLISFSIQFLNLNILSVIFILFLFSQVKGLFRSSFKVQGPSVRQWRCCYYVTLVQAGVKV